jgi:FkbM family methyltransferase
MGLRNIILSLAANIARILPDSYKRALYRNTAFSKVIRKGLNLAAPLGLSEVTIAAGEVEGIQMLIDLQSEKDYWLGTYEADLQTTITDLIVQGQVIYDIGASIGFLTLLFAKRAGEQGHVYAFEALPANVERLMHNLKLNGFQKRVTVIEAAVQDRSGLAEFYPGPSSAMGKVNGSAGRSSIKYQPAIRIKGIAIDDFVFNAGNPAPDLLKIDIEGGEVLALPGMSKLLQDHHPILLVELHGAEAARTSWDLLGEKKYRICRISPGYPQVPNLQDLDWKSYLVAFPDERSN